jgi:hypothetical protein
MTATDLMIPDFETPDRYRRLLNDPALAVNLIGDRLSDLSDQELKAGTDMRAVLDMVEMTDRIMSSHPIWSASDGVKWHHWPDAWQVVFTFTDIIQTLKWRFPAQPANLHRARLNLHLPRDWLLDTRQVFDVADEGSTSIGRDTVKTDRTCMWLYHARNQNAFMADFSKRWADFVMTDTPMGTGFYTRPDRVSEAYEPYLASDTFSDVHRHVTMHVFDEHTETWRRDRASAHA